MKGLAALFVAVALVPIAACAATDGEAASEPPGAAAVAGVTSADPLGLPAGVVAVRSGGAWTEGEAAGSYRVVVVNAGFEHVVSRVYVQWLEVDPDQRGERVRLTATFADINSLPMYSLDIAAFEAGEGGIDVTLSGYNSYSNEPERFVIQAREPGSALLLTAGATRGH